LLREDGLWRENILKWFKSFEQKKPSARGNSDRSGEHFLVGDELRGAFV